MAAAPDPGTPLSRKNVRAFIAEERIALYRALMAAGDVSDLVLACQALSDEAFGDLLDRLRRQRADRAVRGTRAA